MVIANNEVEKSIRDLIRSLSREEGLDKQYCSVSVPFVPFSDKDFAFLQDPSDISGAAYFARMANAVPDSLANWRSSDRMLWNIYIKWLNEYEHPQSILSPEKQEMLRKARAYCRRHYETYRQYKDVYSSKRIDFMYWDDMPPSEYPPDWSAKREAAKHAVDDALTDWNLLGLKTEFETKYAQMVDLGEQEMGLSKTLLRETLGYPTQDPILGDFYYTSLSPSNFLSEKWNQFTVKCLVSGTSDVVWTGKYPEKTEAEAEEGLESGEANASSYVDVTFEMIWLTIMRPWFVPDLLDANCWKWMHSTPANPMGGYPFSNGMINPEGHLIAYTSRMVFVRNVSVKWSKGAQIGRVLAEIPEGTVVGLGPIHLGRKGADWSVKENGITSTQLNFAAMGLKTLKRSPDPDWRLWPPQAGVLGDFDGELALSR